VSDNARHTEKRLISAANEQELLRSFMGKNAMLISIEREFAGRGGAKAGSRGLGKAALEFTEMMTTLLEAGLSLRDSLELLSVIGRDKAGKKKSPAGVLAEDLLEEVRKGVSFARAVQNRPEVFSTIYTGMISIGDRVGSVERIFPRLSLYLKDQKKLRDKIAAALAYPTLVLSVSIFGAIALAIIIIPKMETIFAGFGGDAAEQIHSHIQRIEILFGALGFGVLALVVLLVMCALVRKTNEGFANDFDRMLLRLPIIGGYIRSWETLNFTFAMETLTGGGVSVENAIAEAAALVSNSAFRNALRAAREKIVRGLSLSTVFASYSEFPAYLSQWLAIGEKSGKTERVFSQVRSYFQDEIDRTMARFLSLIEPAMIVLVGVLLLTLITGIILPLFSMYGGLI
jgi:type II secretory pathway component PulF